jgi:PD-(D/E)XK nuclease superfamily protein
MTPFDAHGIDHLSAASLNLWMANPREWAVRYLARETDEADPAMWRGSAVEAGLAQLLHGRSMDAARTTAIDSFEFNAVGDLSEEAEFERSLVLPMLHRASAWTPPGELMASQLRIEHWFDDVPVPLIGYLDFAFAVGIDIDLKTTRACPSRPRGNHLRQVALYRTARSRRGGLLYVTDRKFAYFEVQDADAQTALEDLWAAALSLTQFLAKVTDAEEALACLPYNPDDFRTSPKSPDTLLQARGG